MFLFCVAVGNSSLGGGRGRKTFRYWNRRKCDIGSEGIFNEDAAWLIKHAEGVGKKSSQSRLRCVRASVSRVIGVNYRCNCLCVGKDEDSRFSAVEQQQAAGSYIISIGRFMATIPSNSPPQRPGCNTGRPPTTYGPAR